jgi:endogenous inhibitor of DNA gyrase (YacG/DUF329 family)
MTTAAPCPTCGGPVPAERWGFRFCSATCEEAARLAGAKRERVASP